MRLNDLVKNLLLWVVILVVLTSVFQSFSSRGQNTQSVLNYSDFLQQVRDDKVDTVYIEGQHIRGTLKGSTQQFKSYSPETDNNH
jgi:cell division protease FtsH